MRHATKDQLAHRAEIHANALAYYDSQVDALRRALEPVTVRELDGTLADVLRSLIRAESAVNGGLPGVASDELRAIIDLLLVQLETAPKRALLWD
jgi:hypothetical protein